MKLKRNLTLVALFALSFAIATPPRTAGQSSSGGNSNILPGSLLSINSIDVEGTNVIVKVNVSADFKSIYLESRRRVREGNWEPRVVERMADFTAPAKVVTLRLPLTADMELLRIRGSTNEPLPATFYQGTTTFGVPSTTTGQVDARVGVVAEVGDKAGAPVAAPTTTDSTRTVVESDIWKIKGDILYFFNQYRGLQVLDVADPNRPVLTGTYDLPAAGEQMYLLDTNHVVLLAHGYCNWSSSTGESQIILLEVADGQPQFVTQLAVPGSIRESRLVGTALYVTSEYYRQVEVASTKPGVSTQWEWGSQVTSFDLSRFSDPQPKFKEWVPGYGNAIMATDRFLLIATPQQISNYWSANSAVRIFDISAPDGTTQLVSTVPSRGRVKDKFKMNINGNVLTLVSETSGTPIRTQVETYSLKDPKNPQPLGYLPIIEGEALYATRFDGELLYAVTFKRIDPLWIIDLGEPAQPKKVGELEIPGFSTFIQPLGDRLVTIAIDNSNGWRAAVQLFDVANPAKPSLLSKVSLGDQYSYSEANSDEKAFGVLPDEKLILVPFSTWSRDGNFQGVQLIDLNRDSLTKRGAINHDLQARRATVHRDRILSISGSEVLSVDATDRDHPVVVSSTDLSWAADRVFVQGPHLLEVEGAWANQPALRVVLADQTGQVLNRVKLANLPLLGATVKEKRLYVAQGKSTEVIWPPVYNPTNYLPVATNQANLTLSVFDLSKLPELPLLGQTKANFEDRYWNTLDALWPKPGVLVWSSRSYWGPWILAAATDKAGVAVGAPVSGIADARIGFAPWRYGSDSQFVAFDVNNPAAPTFVSETNLRGTNSWWSFSQAYTAQGLVFVSHQTSEFDKQLQPPPYITYQWDGTKQTPVTNYPPPGAWIQRYYLDVIDYADPVSPTIRKPVNIPGSLIGLSHGGAMIYTQSNRYPDYYALDYAVAKWPDPSDWKELLDASAYDGVEVHLVDSMTLPTTWPHPVLVKDKSIFLGQPGDGTSTKPSLETWTIADTGKFTRAGATPLDTAANGFKLFGDLLTVQFNDRIDLYDSSNPPSLQLRGSGAPPGCFGYNLEYADGTVDRGLWLPLGAYGVAKIEVKP